MTETSRQTAAGATQVKVESVRPCLTFKEGAEEAVNFYVSVFPNSRVNSILRSDGNGPLPKGSLWHASFELDGQEYTAFDGGASFAFTEAFSFVATCETQDELDQIWAQLSEGGEEGPCGWLKDRFGVSWQVVPPSFGTAIGGARSGTPAKMMGGPLE